jgi:hypothetical protein
MVNQNVQEAHKKFQDTKNKEYEKTQKQVNELIGALYKHHSETENSINREIKELKMKIDNIKEDVTHDMEKLRKKNETEIQSTMEGHSSRLGIHNIFNKIITENYPNTEKAMPIQVQEVSRTPNRLDQSRTTPQHIIIKTTITENRERIRKAVREKNK